MEKIFQKGMKIESNTYYKAQDSRYDMYPDDCIWSDNKVYFSYTTAANPPLLVGFLLKDLENVTLDFQGATLVFHGRIVPFILDGCKNVRMINFKVDYDRPFYTQAHVLECSPTRMKIRMDEGFDYRVEDGYLYAVSETWEKNLNAKDCLLWMFDRTGAKLYPIILALFGPEVFPYPNPPLPIGQILVEEAEDNCLVLHGNFPTEWEVNGGNNSLLFTHEVRDKSTITLVNSEDIYIENFLLIHGAALGIMGMNVKNLYVDHFDMYMDYEGNGRLVTNNADAIHVYNCKGNFVLKNSYMEGLLDDTVNIHNNYLHVVRADGKKLACRFLGHGVALECPWFVKGDRIAVYRGRTQERKGEYVIEEVTLDTENKLFLYTLDRDMIDVEPDDVIENLSGQPTILLENCTFGCFRGTMRLQSRNTTVVRNCEFRNKIDSIIFTGDTTYWFESGPVNDFLIENCRFLNTAYSSRLSFFGEVEFTEKEKYYHKNITVRNSYFDAGVVASLNHMDNFVFEGNTSNGVMKIKYRDCGEIRCDDGVVLIDETVSE